MSIYHNRAQEILPVVYKTDYHLISLHCYLGMKKRKFATSKLCVCIVT